MARRDLTNKRIILTGASSGLGKAIAIALAPLQTKIVLNARRRNELTDLCDAVKQLGSECIFVCGDVTNDEVRQEMVNRCSTQFGGIDLLINNAGIGAMGTFESASPQRLRQVFEVNFFSAAELIRTALPLLRDANDPMIVNIGSVLGHRAVPLKSEYCASKFAIHGFSDALRAEFSPYGIDVLHVCPSTIDTGFFDAAVEDTTGKKWKSNSAMKPEYVAELIIRSIVGRKHEIVLPLSGKLLTWLDRLFPSLANRIIARYGQ